MQWYNGSTPQSRFTVTKRKKPLDRICWGMGRVKYQITGSLDYCRKLQIFKVTLGKPLINGKHLLMGAG